MDQKIVHLPDDIVEQLEKQRAWVKSHFTGDADAKYKPVDGKLRLLDAIVSQKWVAANESWKLQALGTVFGDAVAQRLGLVWVMVDEEFGHGPALSYPGTTILAFPLSAISKRIERDESVDIYELFDGFTDKLRKIHAAES